MKKKFLSIAIVLSILLSFTQISVMARVKSYGDCGIKTTWSLNSDRKSLSIDGRGDMYDYSLDRRPPWDTYDYEVNTLNIKKVNIYDGVTSIGDYAFWLCANIEEVSIPSSVKRIGMHAFDACYALKNITIPEGVTTIDDYAFFSHKLNRITIPNSVTYIGEGTFWTGYPDLVEDVIFNGSEEEWNKITIKDNNNCLTKDKIKFMSVSNKNEDLAPKPQSGNGISVILDNNPITFDVPPQIINERTMVPLRAIFEALGASVDWNQETKTVTSAKGDTTIQLTIDSDTMYVNGIPITLDSPACIVDGRTLVPVRAISETYNTNVDWNGDTKTVIISSADNS